MNARPRTRHPSTTAVALAALALTATLLPTPTISASPSCPSPTTLGGVDLGCLTDHLFVFANGDDDTNWQSSSKGYVGDVAVADSADQRTSGTFAYAGSIRTDGAVRSWQRILDANPTQSSSTTVDVGALRNQLEDAIAQVRGMATTPGYGDRSPASLHGLDTTDGVADVLVIDVTHDLGVKERIEITGDAADVFILRWDEDPAEPGLQGKVKFQSGGAIVPQGALTPGNFVHVAGNITASGGGDTPPHPYPQGPRLNDGRLIEGGQDFDGGGFFTGYWLTTGAPKDGKTSSLSNAIFVGGWYTLSTKLSLTSGSSGVHVAPAGGGGGDPGDVSAM